MGVGKRNVRCIGSWGPKYQQGENFQGWDLRYWVYSRLFIAQFQGSALIHKITLFKGYFIYFAELTNTIKHTYFVEFKNIFIIFIFFSIISDLNMKNNIWRLPFLFPPLMMWSLKFSTTHSQTVRFCQSRFGSLPSTQRLKDSFRDFSHTLLI